ncbi:hypothetical protein NDN08_002507 [Rhodosorus marinus]|uniref:G domain-containing protein n=1 Tax=Rhodosorus marinus TaxID=101924 RepID=A0AAV8UY59_9RHOD|nr:hypothetical protein NDN08_002507 [Rhodosorus marinus]
MTDAWLRYKRILASREKRNADRIQANVRLEKKWEAMRVEDEQALTEGPVQKVVPVEHQRFQKVGVVGLPNAGKSSLVSALVNEQVSLVTRKRNTTRRRVRAVLTRDNAQVELVDCPGFVSFHAGLSERTITRKLLAQNAWGITEEADTLMFVVDSAVTHVGKFKTLRNALARLSKRRVPILVMHKMDILRGREEHAVAQVEDLLLKASFREIFFTSAANKKGLDVLANYLLQTCPAHPWQHSPNQVAPDSIELQIHDIVRGEILNSVHASMPYHVVINIVEMQEDEDHTVHLKMSISYPPAQRNEVRLLFGQDANTFREIRDLSQQRIAELLHQRVKLSIKIIPPGHGAEEDEVPTDMF